MTGAAVALIVKRIVFNSAIPDGFTAAGFGTGGNLCRSFPAGGPRHVRYEE
jgi:hypothetical protein